MKEILRLLIQATPGYSILPPVPAWPHGPSTRATHSSRTCLEASSTYRSRPSSSDWLDNRYIKLDLPGGTRDKELSCQCRRCKRHRLNPWVYKIPWRRAWQPTPVFLSGESHGQRCRAGYSPWGRKELDTTEVTQHAQQQRGSLLCFSCGVLSGFGVGVMLLAS